MIKTKAELEEFVSKNWNDINSYIDSEFEGLPVPLYSSVDIRESKDKFAPVDHNMYPAGFNNVCALDLDACTNEFSKLLKSHGDYKTIGILPESNTKNTFYLDHLAILGKTVRDAGYEVEFLSFDETLFSESNEIDLISFSKFDIKIKKAKLDGDQIFAGEAAIDFLILNNDQSSPINLDWASIKTPIHPSPMVGWYRRQKVMHFCFYAEVVEKFANKFDIDPNLLQAKFKKVSDVDFSTKEGLEELAKEVDSLISELPADSNVFVKASQGTYGMGISVVKSGEEILNLNRKKRNKMDVGKNKIKFTTLLIQEGVETVLKYDEMPAEVAIYLVNGKGLGGFMRANSERDSQANLNAKGMVFKRYCISEIRENNDYQAKEAVYSVVARLATLAAAHETKELTK